MSMPYLAFSHSRNRCGALPHPNVPVVELAPICPGLPDQAVDIREAGRSIGEDNAAAPHQLGDGKQVAVARPQLRFQMRGHDHVLDGRRAERVAVRGRPRTRLETDAAAGPCLVLNNHRLAELYPHPFGDGPEQRIKHAAGGERHDDPDRPRGIILCRGRASHDDRQERLQHGQEPYPKEHWFLPERQV